MSIPFLLEKNPRLYRSARPVSSREAPEVFLRAPLARTPSERRRRLALASGFRVHLGSHDRIGIGAASKGIFCRTVIEGTEPAAARVHLWLI